MRFRCVLEPWGGQAFGVYAAAPRLENQLLREIARADDARLPIAETNRRAGELAQRLGVPRPSYERVRQHVREVRRLKARQREKAAIALGVLYYTRPVSDLSKLHE